MKSFARTFALAAIVAGGTATQTGAHPHVFAEARLEVVAAADGSIERLRNVWRFDELFTSTVLLEFDTDADGTMSEAELDALTALITDSISDYNYFLSLSVEGQEYGFSPVDDMKALFDGGQMTLLFTAAPDTRVMLASNPAISVYDPTFYTSIEFYEDDAMAIIDAPGGCTHAMVVPDIDAVLSQQQDTLTEDFFNDPEGNDYSQMFATRMEISCAAGADIVAAAAPTGGSTQGRSSLGIGAAEQPVMPTGGVFGGFFTWVAVQQREFYTLMTDALRSMRDNPSAGWVLIWLSFLYGILHAAGPGHGKIVISSYLLANESQLRRGIALSVASSALQAITAIMVVGAGFLVLRQLSVSVTDATRGFEIASYALVACLGLWLVVSKLRKLFAPRALASLSSAAVHDHHHHHHHHHHHDHAHHHGDGEVCSSCGHNHMPTPAQADGSFREMVATVFSVGLRPCTGALVVLTFAFMNGLWLAGIVSTFAMAVGTAITVCALATLAVSAKGVARRLAGARWSGGQRIGVMVELVAACLILFIGVVLLGGAFA